MRIEPGQTITERGIVFSFTDKPEGPHDVPIAATAEETFENFKQVRALVMNPADRVPFGLVETLR